MKLLILFTTLLGAQAFVSPRASPRPSLTQYQAKGSFDLSSLTENLSSKIEDLDFGAIQQNTFSGELGSRGEVYVAAQFGLLLCILLGGLPVAGPIFFVLGGPILLLAGVALAALGVIELGSDLSPWPKPADGTNLKTDGVYAELRHPIYGGLLAACLGISIATDSASRLLLTAILWYALDKKSDYEEKELKSMFPGYDSYSKSVKSKFVPQTLIEKLPF